MNKMFASVISHLSAIFCGGVVLTGLLSALVSASIAETEKTRYDGFGMGLWMLFAFSCSLFISFPLTVSVRYLKSRTPGKLWMAPLIIAVLGFVICSSLGSGIDVNRFVLVYGIVNFSIYWLAFVNLRRCLVKD